MSTIRLLILGVLKRKQPLHGYDIRRELESWNAEQWANIAYGSIYFSLGKMTEENLVEVATTEQESNRPARTLYQITPKGTGEFEKLLRDYWWNSKAIIDPFQVALTFMDFMPHEELLSALRFRANTLRAMLEAYQHLNPQQPKGPTAPRHIIANFRLLQYEWEARLRWLEETIEQVEQEQLP